MRSGGTDSTQLLLPPRVPLADRPLAASVLAEAGAGLAAPVAGSDTGAGAGSGGPIAGPSAARNDRSGTTGATTSTSSTSRRGIWPFIDSEDAPPPPPQQEYHHSVGSVGFVRGAAVPEAAPGGGGGGEGSRGTGLGPPALGSTSGAWGEPGQGQGFAVRGGGALSRQGSISSAFLIDDAAALSRSNSVEVCVCVGSCGCEIERKREIEFVCALWQGRLDQRKE